MEEKEIKTIKGELINISEKLDNLHMGFDLILIRLEKENININSGKMKISKKEVEQL